MINGVADGLNAKFREATISVTVSGTESSLSELSANLITGYVDAEGLKAGEHNVAITFNLDEQYSASTEVVTLLIEKPGQATDTENSGEASQTDNKNTKQTESNNNNSSTESN